MDKRVKYSFKQKLSTVRSVISGRESCTSAAEKIGGKKTHVQRWVRHYRQHGTAGLRLNQGSYNGYFKLRVIRHMLKNGLSSTRTATLFGIPQDYLVGKWLKKYESLGAAGLLKETRGRKKSRMTKKTKKKKATDANGAAAKVVAMQKELEYLRAENAFLKKLDALIQQEKAAKGQGRRQKSFRN